MKWNSRSVCLQPEPQRLVSGFIQVDADFILRVSVGLLVITAPFDPVKLLFFNKVLTDRAQSRAGAALKVTLYVSIILSVAAVAGKELLEAMGINLHVFGAVGGIGHGRDGFRDALPRRSVEDPRRG